MKKIMICMMVVVALLAVGCQRREVTDVYNEFGVTVRLLTDASGIDDRSFNAAAWRGILEFFGDTWENPRLQGVAYDWMTAQTHDMYIPNLRLAVDEGYDLIIATGFTWADAVDTVAADNPDQYFLIVDVDWLSQPNVMQAVFTEHEGSFLVGAAAALKAIEDGIENPIFGFIGGVPGAVITRFHVGFVQGVLSVLPDAQFVDYYAGRWDAPDLAITQAMNWYDNNVFAIFSAAGQTGNGTIAQAREQRLAGRNVWAIGVDSDQHDEGIYNAAGDSAVLTSMLKMVESSVIYALNAVYEGTFYGRTITFDLYANGVGFSTTNPAMSTSIINELRFIERSIINGEIVVAATLAEAMLLPGFPQNLRAIDD